ncbi:MAG: hypothetical protein ACHQWV_04120 [Nitrospirales bacterium]
MAIPALPFHNISIRKFSDRLRVVLPDAKLMAKENHGLAGGVQVLTVGAESQFTG